MAAAIIAAIISGVILILLAACGWIWRLYKAEKKKRQELEDEVNELESRVDVVWQWAFGRDDDDTDAGIAEDVASGFQNLEGQIGRIEGRLEAIEDAMVDAEEIDVERDELEE